MDNFIKILLLEDNADDAWLIGMYLKRSGLVCNIAEVTVKEEFIEALEREEFDLILSDHGLQSFDSMQALKMARAKYPGVPFILVSGNLPEKKANEILKEGADAYVLKDHYKALGDTIRKVLEARNG